MFKTKKVAYRPWPVTVFMVESDEDGNVTEREETFVVRFRPFDEERIEALRKESEQKFPCTDDSVPMSVVLNRNAYLFSSLVDGWGDKGPRDEDGVLQFSTEMMRELTTGQDGARFSAGMHQAISQLRFGIAPAKNASSSPKDGHAPDAVAAAGEKS